MRRLHSGTWMVMLSLLWISAVLTAQQRSQSIDPARKQGETYGSADVDHDGRLRITTLDGRQILVPKQGTQSAFREPTVSLGGVAVGALADYPNCCTSYDIPLELVVYSKGRLHRFKGIGLPIFQWRFVEGGTRVAYSQEPVHFGCQIHYELRNIASERLIESADVPQPCGQLPDPPRVTVPKWVQELDPGRR